MSATEDNDGDGYPDGFQVDEEDTQQTSGGGGPIINWSSIAPSWLQGNTAAVLKDFAEAPIGFAAGVVLNIVIGGVENVAKAFIKAVLIVLEGSKSTPGGKRVPATGTTEGSLGLADIPRLGAEVLSDAIASAGTVLFEALAAFFETVESAASAAGVFAPIIGAVAVVVVVLAGAYTVRFLGTLIVDTLNPL